jgi:hypothetical protein
MQACGCGVLAISLTHCCKAYRTFMDIGTVRILAVHRTNSLLLVVNLVLVNLEVAERVGVLGGGNNTMVVSLGGTGSCKRYSPEEVLERVLLEVLLREVLVRVSLESRAVGQSTNLQVALREGDLRSEDELVALLRELDDIAKLAGLAVNLDAVVEELLERGGVKDVVVGRDRVVDVELVLGLARVLGSGLGLERKGQQGSEARKKKKKNVSINHWTVSRPTTRYSNDTRHYSFPAR